jgi:tRNA-splicing ligase RtcB
MKLQDDKRFKTLIPIDQIESGALDQIKNCLEYDFVKKLAIMPDVHKGYSLPIGGVALLDNVISPDFVGYDIGCGMVYYDTDIPINKILLNENVKEYIYNRILEEIPVGYKVHDMYRVYPDFVSAIGDKDLDDKVNQKLKNSLGTLGGGNHFIELGETIYKTLGITVHSGSRNPGHTVASFYMEKSKTEDTDLPNGFFHIDSSYGNAYYKDMEFMCYYALENRRRMLFKVLDILNVYYFVKELNFINENHNHAIKMKDGILHRKGATPADKGQLGVIPGNMRDGVFITEGLGNEMYLSSASHGAGRLGSRNWAKKTFTVDSFEKEMKGIIANVSQGTLDESPFAYKDLNFVMGLQEGIVVDIVDYVKPLINIKG